MREIIPSQLWLGNARDARDLRRVHDVGISAIVDLALEESSPQLTRELIYCRIPITDGAANSRAILATAIKTTALFIHQGVPTLVACSAGMSRSPSIVAAALALVRNQSPEETLQELTDGNSHDISPALWSDVKNAYNELVE